MPPTYPKTTCDWMLRMRSGCRAIEIMEVRRKETEFRNSEFLAGIIVVKLAVRSRSLYQFGLGAAGDCRRRARSSHDVRDVFAPTFIPNPTWNAKVCIISSSKHVGWFSVCLQPMLIEDSAYSTKAKAKLVFLVKRCRGVLSTTPDVSGGRLEASVQRRRLSRFEKGES